MLKIVKNLLTYLLTCLSLWKQKKTKNISKKLYMINTRYFPIYLDTKIVQENRLEIIGFLLDYSDILKNCYYVNFGIDIKQLYKTIRQVSKKLYRYSDNKQVYELMIKFDKLVLNN